MTETDRPITLVSSRAACRNAVFTVFLDHIRGADGTEVPDYVRVVPHHRAADGVTGVAVLPVMDGRFGLIRVYRHPIAAHSWETVRGFVDAGEAPAAAAKRELREEAGLDAGRLRELGRFAPEPGLVDARLQLYVAEDCRPAPATASREIGHGEIRYFARDAFLRMLGNGEIFDPGTLICAYRYFGIAS